MSGDASTRAGAELRDAERRYRALVRRWYPASWVSQNGDAMVGTMLDLAEHRGTAALGPVAGAGVAAHGLIAHLHVALGADVRDRVASIGAGTVLGYAAVAAATSGSPIEWEHPHPQLPALLPFLLAWVFVAATSLLRSRGPRIVGLVVAAATTVGTSGAWWGVGPFGTAGGLGSWGAGVGYYGPAVIAPLALLLVAGGSTLLGVPALRDTALTAAVVGALVVVLLLVLTGRAELFEPDWLWTGGALGPSLPPFVGVVIVGAAAVVVLGVRRRHSAAVAVVVALAPWLVAWLVEVVVGPSIAIPA